MKRCMYNEISGGRLLISCVALMTPNNTVKRNFEVTHACERVSQSLIPIFREKSVSQKLKSWVKFIFFLIPSSRENHYDPMSELVLNRISRPKYSLFFLHFILVTFVACIL